MHEKVALDIQVVAALPRDAELVCRSLTDQGIMCRSNSKATVAAIASEIPNKTDILILFEEALDQSAIECLADALRRQPPWSDIPVIVLTGGGGVTRSSERLAKMREPLGNVTLIERPARPITLISSVRAAIRARQKQYEIFGHLAQLQKTEEALRISHENLERKVTERTAALRQLSASLMRAQDDERRRIARELHDSVGQYLAGLSMELGALAKSMKPGLLEGPLKTLQTCVNETRTISYLLHPPLLDEVGLSSAIQWYVDGFVGRSGIQVLVNMDKGSRLPADIETALFRVLQEALTNIHRHSGAKTAEVSLTYLPTEIVLDVVDHGKGMSKASLERFQSSGTAAGVGLAGMRERITEIAGRLQISSNAEGTHIRASIPLHMTEYHEQVC